MAKKESILKTSVFMRLVYTVFLALLVALFWGMGIAAFYPSPKAPETPAIVEQSYKSPGESLSVAEKEAQLVFEKEQKNYNEKIKVYSRNVSMVALGLAVLTLVVSLVVSGRIPILSDGLLLGSVFTLAYAIIRGFVSEDARFRFVVVTVGLLITVFIGYLKFIKGSKESK